MMDDSQHSAWKNKLTPYLYDWIASHKLVWPSQTCRWGPELEEQTYKSKYRMYLSEQTDGSEAQKLIISETYVCKDKIASIETISAWTETDKCPYIKETKVIFHPGEVNKIREIPQQPEIIVTHTDKPELYVWNVEKQPARAREKSARGAKNDSTAELVLIGHKENAQFPLATTAAAPYVASGGMDQLVLLWSLEDCMSSLIVGPRTSDGRKEPPTLQHRTILQGHTATVEDVVFKPGSTTEVLSVGDDQQVLAWDTRTGEAPVARVERAHGKVDIQCCDWSLKDPHLSATGAQDGSVKVWDMRKLGSALPQPLFTLKEHTGGVLRLEWNPCAHGILASGGEDRQVVLWDTNRENGSKPTAAAGSKKSKESPPQLMFKHVGHRRGKVVDFQWLSGEPWTMLSVSDDADEEEAGGTLQLWRINPLLRMTEAEAVAELDKHKDFILEGRDAPALPKKDKPRAAATHTAEQAAHAPQVAPSTSGHATQSAPSTSAHAAIDATEPAAPATTVLPAAAAAAAAAAATELAAAEPAATDAPEAFTAAASEPTASAEPAAAEPAGTAATEADAAAAVSGSAVDASASGAVPPPESTSGAEGLRTDDGAGTAEAAMDRSDAGEQGGADAAPADEAPTVDMVEGEGPGEDAIKLESTKMEVEDPIGNGEVTAAMDVDQFP